MSYYDDDIQTKGFDRVLMRKMLGFLQPFRYWIFLGIFVLLMSSGLNLARPYLIKIAVDKHIAVNDMPGLIRISIIYFIVMIGHITFSSTYRYLTDWIGNQVISSIRKQLFTHIQNLPISYFDQVPVGRIITRAINDVESMNRMLSSGLIALTGDIVMLIGIIIIMLTLHWQLTLLTISILPVIFIVSAFFRTKLREYRRQERTLLARLNSFMQENISGMATVQLFNREARNKKQFEKMNDEHRSAKLKSTTFQFSLYPSVQFLIAIATAFILWYGGMHVLDQALTLGVLIAFIQYLERFARPLRSLADKFNLMQTAMASAERIFQLLEEPVQKDHKSPVLQLPPTRGKIEFRNVSFSYNGGQDVLENVSFTIMPGEKVAIVGATGAGKTTITGLINRLYETDRGQILLDDVDIRHVPLQELRSHIATVLQDAFMFSGSIYENIVLGDANLEMQHIQKAASRVNAHEFIATLENEYEHELAERGSNLSTGQKQLLSFARAIVNEPKILIMDEATSSVDTHTEYLIRDAIHKMMQQRTSIIIAHRLSSIKNVDWILVLHKGRVAEMGTHHELFQKKGIYYKLYQLQYSELS